MSYVALYRKWRPDAFEEVKGQEHIVTTLKNQLVNERVGHAYLFCGTRGTGKTTVAKLFAKSVNCEHPIEGSPCNECDTCKAINKGASMNVIEIDAASNNGVDNIRDIRDEVQYSPAEGRYKVYIIDEVHMLSIGAFNALLKTLEEPPSYVIFILATTEAHKIPVTILSRCQRYDFRRISLSVISERLKDLMIREAVKAEDRAVAYIAKVADGSMRDALSLLDQAIAFYPGQELTYEKVLEVLGAVDIEVFNKLMLKITEMDAIGAVEVIDEIMWQGIDLSQFVTDFTWYMRNMLLLKASDYAGANLDISMENMNSMITVAQKVDLDALMRYINIFSGLSGEIKYAVQKRVILELVVIKLTKPQMETNYDAILDRIRQLEEKAENGQQVIKEVIVKERADFSQNESEETFYAEEELKKKLPPAEIKELKYIISKWGEVKNKMGNPASGMLDEAAVNLGENAHSLIIAYPNNQKGNIGYGYFANDDAHILEVKKVLEELTGKAVNLQVIQKKAEPHTTIENYNLEKLKQMKSLQ